MSVFANVVADQVNAGAADTVDAWFSAWAVANEQDRERALSKAVTPNVQFCDRFSLVDGLQDLVPHVGAAQRFMPGIRLQRKGNIRHCQGTVLADWVAVTTDGQVRMTGANVFVLGRDGRIASVTGFVNA